MKKKPLWIMLAVVLAASGVMSVQAADKVQVCHLPPGDYTLPETANANAFHTITVTENNLPSHLAHGDLAGSCNVSCDTLCDDGNACTVDHHNDCEENGCLDTPEPVDCDDGLLCTADSCDPQGGCLYASIVCDDGDNCTIDVCNPADGLCTASPKECGTLGVCLPDTGNCDYPCQGIACDPADQCHQQGSCVLPGVCVDGAAFADGTACDDGDAETVNDQCTSGVCEGEAIECPCDFSDAKLDWVFTGAPAPSCWVGSDYVLIADSAGGTYFDIPAALVEKVSIWNVPWDYTNDWPRCMAGDYLGPYLNVGYGLSDDETNACAQRLLTWGKQRGYCP